MNVGSRVARMERALPPRFDDHTPPRVGAAQARFFDYLLSVLNAIEIGATPEEHYELYDADHGVLRRWYEDHPEDLPLPESPVTRSLFGL